MAEDTKAEELTDALRDAFAANLRTAVAGLPAHQALQLADTLCRVQLDMLAGKRVTYKASKAIDGEAIAEDWRRGKTIQEIVEQHGCSRVTAYRYHPNKRTRKNKAA
ncbi:hypothetical protein [Marilutibacter alkalisoli]|uniref:Mor transcription activator domain-containing protein n=1 Tax=Marilutibacter alkalisoli TaxID=2591633 RepID=A0A514BTX0_9GAMM|nr:hypothetical protein [Lysobacter alkalisoli]QDH70858.1 hypothetical protein FKV23_12765 [Lysobacter alkalisoli]